MPKTILMGEIFVTVVAPVGLHESVYLEIRRTLHSRRFGASLRDALRKLSRRHPALKQTRISINR
jgi:hypothetical protein